MAFYIEPIYSYIHKDTIVAPSSKSAVQETKHTRYMSYKIDGHIQNLKDKIRWYLIFAPMKRRYEQGVNT